MSSQVKLNEMKPNNYLALDIHSFILQAITHLSPFNPSIGPSIDQSIHP